MSYTGLGAVGPDCAYLQVLMPGTGVYLPGEICPAPTGKTGDTIPKPRWCDGPGTLAVQEALINAGLHGGSVQKDVRSNTLAAMQAIANKYGVPWNGDKWNVSPALCHAIATEVSDKAQKCPGDYPTGHCIVPVKNRAVPGGTPAPGGPPPPPPPTPIDTGFKRSRIMRKSDFVRRVLTVKPKPGPSSQPPAATPMHEQQTQPPAQQPAPAAAPSDGIPSWVYIAGGVAALGAVAFVATR